MRLFCIIEEQFAAVKLEELPKLISEELACHDHITLRGLLA
jgi:hypothetical protein